MLSQEDFQRLRLILQADRLRTHARLEGEAYETDIQFSIRVEKAIEERFNARIES
jgi:hypothetical protein